MSEPVPEMVERGARALCRLQCERNRRGEWVDDEAIGQAVDCAWLNWADEARAIIKAMREPTHQMMVAGDKVLETETDNPASWEAWRAMLNAALTPTT
jgi:hypothetical protein